MIKPGEILETELDRLSGRIGDDNQEVIKESTSNARKTGNVSIFGPSVDEVHDSNYTIRFFI